MLKCAKCFVCVRVCVTDREREREREYKYLTSAAYIRPCFTLGRMFTHLTLQLSSLSIVESLSFQCKVNLVGALCRTTSSVERRSIRYFTVFCIGFP